MGQSATATLTLRGNYFGQPKVPTRAIWAVIAAVVGIVVGQTFSSLWSTPARQPVHATGVSKPASTPTVKVEAVGTDEVAIDFPPGTTLSQAFAAVAGFDLTFISGDAATGRYLFRLPSVSISQVNADTARIAFPRQVTLAEALDYLATNQLRLIAWIHNADGVRVALVQLPLVHVTAQLVDPLRGIYRIVLPAGLALSTVLDWLRSSGLTLISYDQSNGITFARVIRAASLLGSSRRLTPPIRRSVPLSLAAPPPSGTPLYVRFSSTLASTDITTIGKNLGLTFTAVDGNGLMATSADPMRINALLQLLSDQPGVACAATTAGACSSTPTGAAPQSSASGTLTASGAADTAATTGTTTSTGSQTSTTVAPAQAIVPAPSTTTVPVQGVDPTCPASLAPAPTGSTVSGAASTPTGQLAALPGNGHVRLCWTPATGATAYHVYRSETGGAPASIATTTDTSFLDRTGQVGATYSYKVVPVAPDGSDVAVAMTTASATWPAPAGVPTVLQSLPPQANQLTGVVHLQVTARSAGGARTVSWSISGPLATRTIGSGKSQATAYDALTWTAALNWDSTAVPDGTYTITATVTDHNGGQTLISQGYRVQNAAPESPTRLSATAGNNGTVLTWQQPATSSAVMYRIYRDQPALAQVLAEIPADQRSYLDRQAGGSAHRYTVVLVDADGRTSSPVSVGVAAATSGSSATAAPTLQLRALLPTGRPLATDGRVTNRLLLSTNVIPGATPASFALSSDGNSWSAIDTQVVCGAVCNAILTVGTLAPGPYLVHATTSLEGQTLTSAPVSMIVAPSTPLPEPTLRTETSPQGIVLNWTVPDDVRPLGFALWRRGIGDWTLLDDVTGSSYVDGSAPAGLALSYKLQALDRDGNAGAFSSTSEVQAPIATTPIVSPTASIAAPAGLEALIGTGGVGLSWQLVTGADSYAIERARSADGPFVQLAIVPGNRSVFADPAGPLASEAYYRIRAVASGVAGPASSVAAAIAIPLIGDDSAPLPPATVSAAGLPVLAPAAPVATATSSGIQLSWKPVAMTTPVTYRLYRFDPRTSGFTMIASGLSSTTYLDAALDPGLTFGYVVSASDQSGTESRFSPPVWAQSGGGTPSPPQISLFSAAPLGSVTEGEQAAVSAAVSADAGVASVSFYASPDGTTWFPIPGSLPNNLPNQWGASLSGDAALWTASWHTNGLKPGAYSLKTVAVDATGRSTQRIDTIQVEAAGARAPPGSLDVQATPTPNGVRLDWSASTGNSFQILRSIFGTAGPFQPVATTAGTEYQDNNLIPSLSYHYQVRELGAGSGLSQVITAQPLNGSDAGGVVTSSESAVRVNSADGGQGLALSIAPVSSAPVLPSNVRQVGSAYAIDAVDLGSGALVHQLVRRATVAFKTTPGTSEASALTMAIYHYDESTQSWAREASQSDVSLTWVSADVWHFSLFALAAPAGPDGGGGTASWPTAPTDFQGAPAANPSTPAIPAAVPVLQAAADGEIIAKRTQTSTTYRNPDGTLRTVVSMLPVHYRDAAGNWQNIDTSLVATPDGGMRNGADSEKVHLPADLSSGSIDVTNAAGETVRMSLNGAGRSAVQAINSEGRYAGVLPGVDAEYSIQPGAVKESLVLQAPPTRPLSFTFTLDTGGLRLQPSGRSFNVVNAQGSTEFTIEAPFMQDAFADRRAPSISDAIDVRLAGANGHYLLTYTPSAAWLNDPSRIYPIRIDPTMTVGHYRDGGTDERDTFVADGSPGTTFATSFIDIGRDTNAADNWTRGLLSFSYSCSGCWASNATLSLYERDNWYYPQTFQASEIYQGWSPTSATWNNQPASACPCDNATTSSGTTWLSWNVTNIVHDWEQGIDSPNLGILIHNTGEFCACYDDNLFQAWDYSSSSVDPQLVINYEQDLYGLGVTIPTGQWMPGGNVQASIVLQNTGVTPWDSTYRLSYRWVQTNGTLITDFNPRIYLPYTPMNQNDYAVINTTLQAPNYSSPMYLQFNMVHENVVWFSAMDGVNQYSWSGGSTVQVPQEVDTITGRSLPPVIVAPAGTLITIPIAVTNNSIAAWNYSWSSSNNADIIRIGSRDYRTLAGNSMGGLNGLTYLPSDVAPGQSVNVDPVFQLPSDPGDYNIRIDLVRDNPGLGPSIWFEDRGNQPLSVRVRVVAPGEDKAAYVPIAQDDGSNLGVNSSNGYATLQTTDFDIAEKGTARLRVTRTYNGANAGTDGGVGSSSAIYGAGWTFDFQRSVRFGGWGGSTRSFQTGILTDANGRSFALTWNPGRGLWEDAANDRTVTASTAYVDTPSGPITVPGVFPVDVIARNGLPIVSVGGSPRGPALSLTGSPPNALVMPTGMVPVQQNGSIEFWFSPNFNMATDTSQHVLFSDTTGSFKLAWNTDGNRTFQFITSNGSASDTTISPAETWAAGTWHHIGVTWQEGKGKQLLIDQGTAATSGATHGQAPIKELYFGYAPSGTAYGLNGYLAELRIEGHVLTQSQLQADGALNNGTGVTLTSDPYTLYLGTFVSSVQSTAGLYTVHNTDQTTEDYDPATGRLVRDRDRFGNAIHYSWDSVGRLTQIYDEALTNRSINFAYQNDSSQGLDVVATDFSNRTVTYQVDPMGNLISVTKSNIVPDPLTGYNASQPAKTNYAYVAGHNLNQITDARNSTTTINYIANGTADVYKQAVLDDSPVAYYRLDEASGTTAADSSGHGLNGTIYGGVTLNGTGALPTSSDTAYRFDGSTGYVDLGTPSALNLSQFTVEAWWDGAATQQFAALVQDRIANQRGFQFTSDMQSSTWWAPHLVVWDGTNEVVNLVANFQLALPFTGYAHMVWTWDGANAQFFLNGQQIPVQTSYWHGFDNTGIYLARDWDYLGGHLDEVAIYGSVLPANRIRTHYDLAFAPERVQSVRDANLNTVATFTYNDSMAVNQVTDGNGATSYYTFQQYGGRTMSVTDTGGNTTSYDWDGGAAYRLNDTISPTGQRTAMLMNSGAPIGQQSQLLMQDLSNHPADNRFNYINGSYPGGAVFASDDGTTSTTVWDTSVELQPGTPSQVSPQNWREHQHYFTGASPTLIPSGASLTQWVYVEPGAASPGELMLQFHSTDASGWNHRAYWGYDLLQWGNDNTSQRRPIGAVPPTGVWVPLSVVFGPSEWGKPDVGMANLSLDGMAFSVYGGSNRVWWGPTIFDFPPPKVSDPVRTIQRYSYTAANDPVASIDPLGIGNIKDVDTLGLVRQDATGVEPPSPTAAIWSDGLTYGTTNTWSCENASFQACGSGVMTQVSSPQYNANGVMTGSLQQTSSSSGDESDLYHDVTGLNPGTYVKVSVWVQTSGSGTGGAGLFVEDKTASPTTGIASLEERRSAFVQSSSWVQLTLPFVVDESGQIRIHLRQWNFSGTSTWANVRVDDLAPAPATTFQDSATLYATDFETSGDRGAWTFQQNAATATGGLLQDATQAHGGAWSAHINETTTTANAIVYRTITVPAHAATYLVSAWVRTVASGTNSGLGGASLRLHSSDNVVNASSYAVRTEGQWRLLQLQVSNTTYGSLILELTDASFQGDAYFDDVSIVQVDPGGAWSAGWQTSLLNGAAATWSLAPTAGLGGVPARHVSITTPGNVSDISDALTTSALHTNYSYVISLWASSTVSGTTIDFSLRDSGGNLLPMDFPSSCILDTTPTLCQNSVTYLGTDGATGSLTIQYGGQGARDVYVSHPLVALSSQLQEFTTAGHVYRTRDIFGHEIRTDYDSSGLYPIQQIEKQSPNYWSLGWSDGAIDNWTLWESSGNVANDGNNSHPGTVYGNLVRGERGPQWAMQERTSRFDGSTAYVEVPYSSQLNPSSAVSVEAWAYVTGGKGTYRDIVTSRSSTPSWSGYQLDASNGDQWEFWVASAGTWYRVAGSSVVLNQWTHLIGTFANGTMSLYVDGNLVQSAGASYTPNPSQPLRIGAGTTEGAASYFFPGLIGDVWVYGTALTADRVRLHFWAARGKVDVGPPNYPGAVQSDAPVAEWRLGEQSNIQTSSNQVSGGEPLYYYGGLAFGTPGAINGDSDTAVTFTGASMADRWTDINPTTGPWTLEAWINPSRLGQGPATVISVVSQNTGHGYSFGLGDGNGNAGNHLEACFFGNGCTDSGYVFPSANAWYHVVVTRDAPSTPAIMGKSSTSGSLAAGTYAYRVSATWGAGSETPASSESSYTLSATGGISFYWNAVPGASGYKVYGRRASAELLLASVSSGTTSFTDNGSITPSGALPTSAPATTRFYVNGAQVGGTSALPVTLELPSDAAVGAQVYGSFTSGYQFFAGAIDEPAMYSSALTAARILAHYQAGTSGANPPTYAGTVLADSPTGFWRLGEKTSTTTAVDSSGNGYTLTLGNQVALDSYGAVQSDNNTAMTFLGSSASVAHADTDVNPTTGPFSLEAWLQPSYLPQSSIVMAVANRNGTGAGYGFGVGTGSGGTGSRLEAWFGNNGWVDSGYNFPNASSWYHVVMTRDAPSTPTGLALAATTGNLAAGSYGYRVTATWGAGKETSPSAESSITLSATGGVSLSWGAVSGVTGYRIYGRTVNGEKLLATVLGSTATSWTDDGSTTPTDPLPTSLPATTRFYVNGIQTPYTSQLGLTLDLPTNASLGYINELGGLRYFAGSIDEAAIYNTALPPARIVAHWLAAQAGASGLTQQFQYNQLGQLTQTVQDPYGNNPITDRRNLDSWGRLTAEIRNVVPWQLSDQQTNVWTGHAYDANGNQTDQYDWSASSPTTSALTAYLTSTNDSNIGSSVRQLSNTAPTPETTAVTPIGTATGYGELCSQGCSGGWGSTYNYWPSYHGFAWDTSTLNGKVIPAGNWTPTMKIGSTAAPNTLIADIHVRVWDLDYYYGYWKLLADSVLTGQSIDNTNRTYSLPATSGPMVNFYASDYLYVDVVLNVTSNTTNSSATTVSLYENGSAENIVSPGYGPMPVVDTHYVYDANGNRTQQVLNYVPGQSETSSQNNTTNYVYDAMNELTHTIRPASSVGGLLDIMNVYDSGRRLIQVVENYNGTQDPSQANVTTTYTYDADGRVQTISEPVGRNSGTADVVTSTKYYDALGRLITDVAASSAPSWMQAAPAQTDYTLDADGRTTDVLNPGTGNPATRIRTHYTYDALGRTVKVTVNCVDANGVTCGGTQDAQTNVSSQTIYDPRGAVTTITPPTQAQPAGSSLIASGGVPTRTDMDFSGRTIWVSKNYVPASPSSDVKIWTRYYYDRLGRLIQVLDPNGFTAQIDYDNLDRQIRNTPDYYGLHLPTTYGYNLAGDRTTTMYQRSDSSYRTDLTQYDALHRPISSTLNWVPGAAQDTQTNLTTTYTYDDESRVVTSTDPLGRVTRTTYDALGRRVALTENCVDANGVTCGATPDYQTNVKTQWQVDKSGAVTAMLAPRTVGTDAINQTTTYAYDAQGRLVQVVDDAGSSAAGHLNILTKYAYDPAGHTLTGFDGNNNPTTLTVDALGRVTSVKDALNNVQQTQYSAAGEVVARINGRNQTNSLTLDHVGRVLSESYLRSDGTAASINFTYDPNGQMTSFGTSDTATTYVYYDGVGRVTQVVQGSLQTTYSYYSEGPISQIVDPAETTNFNIDQVGKLMRAQTYDPRFGWSQPTTYQYDMASRLIQRQESNGSTNNLYSNFQYSALDQLIDKNLYQGGVGYVAHWANITYDLNGNRTATTSTLPTDTMAGTETFTYDTVDRLATAAQPTRATLNYGYDAAMNRTTVSGGSVPQGSTSFAYLANEALNTETPTGQTAIPYTPDADGNITTDAAGHQLKYDSLNRLDRVLDRNGVLQVSYVYDALGRLVKRTASGVVTQFVYQGLSDRVVEELDGNNNLLRAYTWDTLGRQLAVQIYTGGTWQTFLLVTDPHGNVVALANGAGTVVVSQHFDAWGQLLVQSGQFGGMPFGFQDGFTDPYTGFVQMGARWYDPREGRFTTEDPRGPLADAQNPLDENLWAYALDDPERYVDPTGLAPWDNIVHAVSNAWNTASHWVSSTWNSFTSSASDDWNEFRHFVRHTWDSGVSAVQSTISNAGQGVQRAWNWTRRTVATGWHAITRTAHYFAQRGIRALGMVARSYINLAKGVVSHAMHIVQTVRETASHVARAVVNSVKAAAGAVGSAVKTAWNFCTGSARGAATCLAIAGSVALIASGVGAGAGVGMLATTLFLASSAASAVSFAQTGDPMDALGAIPMLGVAKDAEVGADLGSKVLPKALTIGKNADLGVDVYLGVRDGKSVYTGITNDLVRRAAQHGDRFTGLARVTRDSVTRGQARAIEQALIVRNRGTFENIRNSISPTHDYYQQAVDWGEAWLRRNGY